jgi:hypothetical protein
VSAATFVLVLVPAQLLGQDAAPAVMLEPAIYADSGLRDPFDPLTVQSASDAGPRFETLRLTGVFLGSPGNSLAVLEDPSRRGHFLRVGEGIAGARLIQILPDAAVFEVEEYGTARREVLRLERSEEKP